MREGFLGADTPQGDKLRGRRDQLSHGSPPGFVLNLRHFPSLSIFCRPSREKRRRTEVAVRESLVSLSLSQSWLSLLLSQSYFFSWL